MRKLMIVCLLASAAAPALARPRDSDDRPDRPSRSESRSRSDSSSEGRSVPVQRERPVFGGSSRRDEPRPRFERPQRSDPSADTVSRHNWGGDRRADRDGVRVSPDGVRSPDDVGRWRDRVRERRAEERRVRNPADAQVDEARRQRWQRDRRASTPNDGSWDERVRDRTRWTPREGSEPPVRDIRDRRESPRTHWRSDWRNDRRYDWRRHRDRNRSKFHIGIYYDPFGWNYRRYNVGWRLWPDYYSSNYWLNDPWQYRLPAAYPGTRWIRYHNDALLVDTWTGEVVDVIYNFFW